MKYVTDKDAEGQLKEIAVTHKQLGEITLSDYSYPQNDSIDEFTNDAGGSEKALEWINSHRRKDAIAVGRAMLVNAPENINIDALKEKVKDAIKNHSPQGGERATTVNKRKAAVLDEIQALVGSGKQLTQEQLLELLAQAK